MPGTPHSKNSRKPCPKTVAGKSFLFIKFRYAVYELEYPTNDGRIESKIIFILYAPDICNSAEKFLYATSKEELKKKIQPFNKELQVNDWADLDDEAFVKYFKH